MVSVMLGLASLVVRRIGTATFGIAGRLSWIS